MKRLYLFFAVTAIAVMIAATFASDEKNDTTLTIPGVVPAGAEAIAPMDLKSIDAVKQDTKASIRSEEVTKDEILAPGDDATGLAAKEPDHPRGGSMDNCATPFPEGFEGLILPSLPSCWTNVDVNNDTKTWKTTLTAGHFHSGSRAVEYMYSSSNAADDWLFSPSVALNGGTQYQFRYWQKIGSGSYPERWEIKYGSAPNAAGMTGTIQASTISYLPSWSQWTNDFTPATTGTYYIGIHCISNANMYYLAMDDFELEIVSAGNVCASALPLSVPGTVSGSTVGYFNDYDAACGVNGTAPDVVYSYTPTANQNVTFSLCGGTTNYDTRLFVYQDACSGTPMACNDDACNNPPLYTNNYLSRIDCLPLMAGHTYYIVVDGYGSASGDFTLSASECQLLPGDVCETALQLIVPGTVLGTTVGFANNYDAACTWASTASDVVYSYMPTIDENVTLSLCGGTTNYDTKMYVYQDGCSGSVIACSDNACNNPPLYTNNYLSRIDCLPLMAGHTYYVVVDGYGSASGDFTLECFGVCCAARRCVRECTAIEYSWLRFRHHCGICKQLRCRLHVDIHRAGCGLFLFAVR